MSDILNKRRMLRSWCIGIIAAIAVILAIGCARAAQAQGTSSTEEQPLPSLPQPRFIENSVSLGTFAQLTGARLPARESLDPSAGVLGTWRQSFWPWLGYSFNFGYTRTAEHVPFGSSSLRLPSNVYEWSFSYLAENHITTKLTGFLDAGAGWLHFRDIAPMGPVDSAESSRPLGTAGIGVDYSYSRHWALRAEYRGLIYKYADYGSFPKAVTLSSEPTVSVVYSFGRRAARATSHDAK